MIDFILWQLSWLAFFGLGGWISVLVENKKVKIKFMNSKAALCMALLKGEVISIRTGFFNLGITNVPREIGRSVERSFGVIVSRTSKEGKSKWGVPCNWTEYRLNNTKMNEEGRAKMIEYVKAHIEQNPKTDKQNKLLKQSNLFL